MGSWADTMNHTVTVAPITSYSNGGAPVYGVQVEEVRCRIEGGGTRAPRRDGDGWEPADLIVTETPIDASNLLTGGWDEVGIWLPGADTEDDNAAIRPRYPRRS